MRGTDNIYVPDMSGKDKPAADASEKGGSFEEQAEAYLYAVGVLRDALLELDNAGIAPIDQCDALAYTLVNMLTERYSEEHALVLLETLQAMLKECYEAGLGCPPNGTTRSLC